jgi:amino acid transporter
MWNSRDSKTALECLAPLPVAPEMPAGTGLRAGRATRVVVATSVMLTFISFWRAAAIVLCDLGSSAFYVGGIAEHAIGKAAPWFILGVMCFSYAVRAIYIESCAMFTRGGVYRVVKEAMGGTLAKLSVSALMFDYVLTGPISGVSAGQYVVGLTAQILNYFGYAWQPSKETINLLAAFVAVLVTVYFWWRNTQGIHKSSGDALRIMQVTTAMVLIMILWSGLTILKQPDKQRLPPSPIPQNLVFNHDAVGWVPRLAPQVLRLQPAQIPAKPTDTGVGSQPGSHYVFPKDAGALLGLIGILMAFGHSILAMSGEESLAQVNREIQHPKHKNLTRAALVIFIYSLLFTSLVSFFAYAIIPDADRSRYSDNLISGIAMNLSGPTMLKLLFQAFVVVVGFLILSGAVNTAIIGSTGVLSRVSEDGVLAAWFRAPHRRFGTSHRIINLIVLLQLFTILGSRGNIYTLGEAYAFGVVWSFAFKGLAVLALRFKDRTPREWKVPFNLRLGGKELPIGLCLITAVLFSTAAINLVTKQVATISGLVFTAGLFTLFTLSQRSASARKEATGLDEFTVVPKETVDLKGLQLRPAPVVVAARGPNNLKPLELALTQTDVTATDVVVMTARIMQGAEAGFREIYQEHLFTDHEQTLFTRVVALAEKAGKPVRLLTVASNNPYAAIVNTAVQLGAARVYIAASERMTGEAQARLVGDVWEQNPAPDKAQFDLILASADSPPARYEIGAHAPDLSPDDIDLIHRLWLELAEALPRAELHHRDVVTLALQHLQRQFEGPAKAGILAGIRRAHAPEPKGQPYPGMLQAETRARRDTHMLTQLMGLDSQARGVMHGTPALEIRGDGPRRDMMLSFCGTILSFCIPPVLLIGVIWNPAGIEGDALMALLAVLAVARLGIALAKMRTIYHRDRPQRPVSEPQPAAAWHSDESLHSLQSR